MEEARAAWGGFWLRPEPARSKVMERVAARSLNRFLRLSWDAAGLLYPRSPVFQQSVRTFEARRLKARVALSRDRRSATAVALWPSDGRICIRTLSIIDAKQPDLFPGNIFRMLVIS